MGAFDQGLYFLQQLVFSYFRENLVLADRLNQKFFQLLSILCGLLDIADLLQMADHLVSDLSEVVFLLFQLQLSYKFMAFNGDFVHIFD